MPKKIPSQITFRIGEGSLRDAIQAHCDQTGDSPSKVMRDSLAMRFSVDAPKMDGHIKAINKVNASGQNNWRK